MIGPEGSADALSIGPTVILIGPMAVGKSTVGREVARQRQEPFADLDTLIAEEAGRSIPEIFAVDGEEFFRALEATVLKQALEHHCGVLALGGGAPLRAESAARLRGRPVVLMEVEEDIVGERIQRSTNRPMLDGPDALARWRELTAARMPVYRELARWTVRCGRDSIPAVARRIDELVREETA